MEDKATRACDSCARRDECEARYRYCYVCGDWYEGCSMETCGSFRLLSFTECAEHEPATAMG